MGLQRLCSKFHATTLCVISEDSMIPLCRKYGINWVFHKNEPLGEKKNVGLTHAMKMKWDYLIELGSDDLIKDEAMELYDDSEMQGIDHVAYINSETGECRNYVSNTSFGLGRKIRRDVVERLCKGVDVEATTYIISPGRSTPPGNTGFFPKDSAEAMEKQGMCKVISDEKYKLWKDTQMRGCDNQALYFLSKFGVKVERTHTENPLLIDIKSRENIWAFNPSLGQPYDMKSLMEGLSQDEQSAICSLLKRNQCAEKQVVR